MLCDFCSATNPEWAYPCKPISRASGYSDDRWAACELCKNAIETHPTDPAAIIGLMYRRLTMNNRGKVGRENDEGFVLVDMTELHHWIAAFLASRTGPCRPITPTELKQAIN